MTTIDEQNVAATIVALKAAAIAHGRLPMSVELVKHDEALSANEWRRLALRFLLEREEQKEKTETLSV